MGAWLPLTFFCSACARGRVHAEEGAWPPSPGGTPPCSPSSHPCLVLSCPMVLTLFHPPSRLQRAPKPKRWYWARLALSLLCKFTGVLSGIARSVSVEEGCEETACEFTLVPTSQDRHRWGVTTIRGRKLGS